MIADEELQAILSKIDQEKVVKLARSSAQVFAPVGQEGKMAELLVRSLNDMGCQTEILEVTPGRPNIISRLKGNGEGYSLLLNGHLDSNNDMPFNGWTKDPFGGELSDGRVYGEGMTDMKGGDVAMLMALAAVKDAGLQLKGDVIYAATIGHSEHGLGVEQLVQRGIVADMAVIGEPTDMNVCVTHRALVNLDLETKGLPIAYHTTTSDRGVNAIEKMAQILVAMKKIRWKRPAVTEEINRFYPGPTCYWNVGEVEGGFDQGSGYSTVPNYCKAKINVRPMYGKDHREMYSEMQAVIDGVKNDDPKVDAILKIKDGFPLPSLWIEPNSPLVRLGSESVSFATGRQPKTVMFDWTTDGGILQKAGIPTVVWGPCESLYDPQGPDEFITVEELVGATRSYAIAAAKLCTQTKEEFKKSYARG